MGKNEEKMGFFIACYEIGGDKPGAPLFKAHFGVYTPAKRVTGFGHITQTTNPPLDIETKLEGHYSYMSTMKDVHILVTAVGYPPIGLPPYGGMGPVIMHNVELHMVLNKDWKSGMANYKYLDAKGNWHNIDSAPVKSVPCKTLE